MYMCKVLRTVLGTYEVLVVIIVILLRILMDLWNISLLSILPHGFEE